jgi:hypothetical protein
LIQVRTSFAGRLIARSAIARSIASPCSTDFARSPAMLAGAMFDTAFREFAVAFE